MKFTTQLYQEQSGTQQCLQRIKQGTEHWIPAHGFPEGAEGAEGAATLWQAE